MKLLILRLVALSLILAAGIFVGRAYYQDARPPNAGFSTAGIPNVDIFVDDPSAAENVSIEAIPVNVSDHCQINSAIELGFLHGRPGAAHRFVVRFTNLPAAWEVLNADGKVVQLNGGLFSGTATPSTGGQFLDGQTGLATYGAVVAYINVPGSCSSNRHLFKAELPVLDAFASSQRHLGRLSEPNLTLVTTRAQLEVSLNSYLVVHATPSDVEVATNIDWTHGAGLAAAIAAEPVNADQSRTSDSFYAAVSFAIAAAAGIALIHEIRREGREPDATAGGDSSGSGPNRRDPYLTVTVGKVKASFYRRPGAR